MWRLKALHGRGVSGWGLQFPQKALVSLPHQPVGRGMYLAGTEPLLYPGPSVGRNPASHGSPLSSRSFSGVSGFLFHSLSLWVLGRTDGISVGGSGFPNGYWGKQQTNKTTATENLHPPAHPRIQKPCIGADFCILCSLLYSWHLEHRLAHRKTSLNISE